MLFRQLDALISRRALFGPGGRRALLSLATVATMLTSCGLSKNGPNSQPTSQGIALPQSTSAGLAFSASDLQTGVHSSTLYYYDFASGQVRTLFGAQSQDPAVFWQDGSLLVFNRTADTRTMARLDPRSSSARIPPTVDLSQVLGSGDPWDVLGLGNGQLLLAMPGAQKVAKIDSTSGELLAQSADSGIKPAAFFKGSAGLFVLGLGVDGAAADGKQSVAPLNSDLQINTAASTPIAVARAARFLDQASGQPLLVGFCAEDDSASDCQSAVQRFDPATGKVQTVFDLSSQGYDYAGTVVDGPDDNTVYASVKKRGTDKYFVVAIDAAAKTVTPVHQFSSPNPFGLFFDSASKTLLVGDQEGLKGEMVLYDQQHQKLGSFELDAVPYTGAIVPR